MRTALAESSSLVPGTPIRRFTTAYGTQHLLLASMGAHTYVHIPTPRHTLRPIIKK